MFCFTSTTQYVLTYIFNCYMHMNKPSAAPPEPVSPDHNYCRPSTLFCKKNDPIATTAPVTATVSNICLCDERCARAGLL